jgi:hypothetical protein
MSTLSAQDEFGLLDSNQMNIDESNITGLDEEEPKYIYLYNKYDPSNIRKVLLGKCLLGKNIKTDENKENKDPVLSTYIKDTIENDNTVIDNQEGFMIQEQHEIGDMNEVFEVNGFHLVIDYIEAFTDADIETPAVTGTTPDTLKEKLQKWLDENPIDKKIFGEYMDLDERPETAERKRKMYERIGKLFKAISIANYLGMDKLIHKLASFISLFLIDRDPDTLAEIMPVNPNPEPESEIIKKIKSENYDK